MPTVSVDNVRGLNFRQKDHTVLENLFLLGLLARKAKASRPFGTEATIAPVTQRKVQETCIFTGKVIFLNNINISVFIKG